MTAAHVLTGSALSMKKALRTLVIAVFCLLVVPVKSFALTLELFDESSLAAIKKRHEGQAFVLVFWSVRCEFCGQEMSYWRVLKRKHPGVPVIMVSMDPPSHQQEVGRFIESHNPGKASSGYLPATGSSPSVARSTVIGPIKWAGFICTTSAIAEPTAAVS